MKKYFIIFIASLLLAYVLRNTIPALNYESYKETLSALLNISSIIFAIIGAWIAIIYPRAIGRVFQGLSVETVTTTSNNDAQYLSDLVEIVMVSAIVLMFVLSIQFFVPILKPIIPIDIFLYAKYVLFITITMLTFSQLHAILRVIKANYFFLNELRNKNNKEILESLHNTK